MKLCKYCGAKIDWNDKMRTWVEVDTDDIHYCTKAPESKGFGDNDNVTIGKMLDAKAAVEVLKPSKEKDHTSELSRNLASLDNEFQDYKRKTDKRINELEEQIKKLTSK
jgi:hypothetical protein